MAGKRVRVGLVGCGFFSRNHLHSWKELADAGADLVAVCDVDAGKAEAAAREFGVPRWYSDFDAMLKAEPVDLLDIVTRMDTHRGLVEKAVAAGVATIVQKPFAPDWDEAVAMTRAAERAGVFLAVHENFRFQVPIRRAHEVIAAGEIGPPSWGRVSLRTGFDLYRTQPYFYTEERFIILDLGVHTLDVARFLLGEVAHLSAETQRRNPKVRAEDTATVLMRHVDGAVSVVDFSYESRTLPDPFPETILQIEGSQGSVVIDAGLTMRVTSNGSFREENVSPPLGAWMSKPWHVIEDSVFRTCRHLLESYMAGQPAETSAHDNLKTFALAEAAYEAAESSRVVEPRQFA